MLQVRQVQESVRDLPELVLHEQDLDEALALADLRRQLRELVLAEIDALQSRDLQKEFSRERLELIIDESDDLDFFLVQKDISWDTLDIVVGKVQLLERTLAPPFYTVHN